MAQCPTCESPTPELHPWAEPGDELGWGKCADPFHAQVGAPDPQAGPGEEREPSKAAWAIAERVLADVGAQADADECECRPGRQCLPCIAVTEAVALALDKPLDQLSEAREALREARQLHDDHCAMICNVPPWPEKGKRSSAPSPTTPVDPAQE